MTELQCKTCGRIFLGRKDQKYCSESCRRAWYKGETAPIAKYRWNNPLAKAAVAAAQQGMSYGHAQAQKLAASVKIERKKIAPAQGTHSKEATQ